MDRDKFTGRVMPVPNRLGDYSCSSQTFTPQDTDLRRELQLYDANADIRQHGNIDHKTPFDREGHVSKMRDGRSGIG